jgi:hypothetical protein
MKKKHVLAICAISGVLFAAVPAVAYLLLLFNGLAFLSFNSVILSFLLKIVWIFSFGFWMLPPIIGFCVFQFMIGFAEAMKIVSPEAPEVVLSPQEEKDLDDKFVRNLPSAGDSNKEETK